MLRLERTPDGFVEWLATDFDPWRRAKPVQQPRLRRFAPPAGRGVHQENVFVAALVARASDERHQLFSFLRLRRFFCGFRARRRSGPRRLLHGWTRRLSTDRRRRCGLRRGAGFWRRRDLTAAVHKCEAHFIAERVIAPDLVYVDLVVFT